ncbi:MAG: AAA family ATPase, partial [Deltaproteobacteria bacterium]|nr:AAA family ATPase [Deltaproteobacteria bacterium]
FVVIYEPREPDGLKTIDLGAGHASAAESLCGRIITASRSQGLLNVSVGAGYIERNWPPALKESGAWPLTSLRQSFLNGSLTRLLDPDEVLRTKIVEFVSKGEFGMSSGPKPDGTYERVWYAEMLAPEEVSFEAGVFLLRKEKAKVLKQEEVEPLGPEPPKPPPEPEHQTPPEPPPGRVVETETKTLRLIGTVPPELWNKLGIKLIPKLRMGDDLKVSIEFSVTLKTEFAQSQEREIRQAIEDLGLGGQIKIEYEG